MIPAIFIGFEIQRGEAEFAVRLRYLAKPLDRRQRMHRKQGVWGNTHLVCIISPEEHRQVLTTYNQSRTTNHR